jgi:hypothetical protein
MTLPDERYRAVMMTKEFLLDLLDPKTYPRIPRKIRDQAKICLRHYPSGFDLEAASRGSPEVFQRRMEPVSRLIMEFERDNKLKE